MAAETRSRPLLGFPVVAGSGGAGIVCVGRLRTSERERKWPRLEGGWVLLKDLGELLWGLPGGGETPSLFS